MTIAEQIATQFKDDGQLWEIEDQEGNTLKFMDVCKSKAVKKNSKTSEYGSPYHKFIFEDGSSIVTFFEFWDLGINDDENSFTTAQYPDDDEDSY